MKDQQGCGASQCAEARVQPPPLQFPYLPAPQHALPELAFHDKSKLTLPVALVRLHMYR
jgi:hypothetical protein